MWLSLLAAILCIGVMFWMQWVVGLVTLAIAVFFYGIVFYRSPGALASRFSCSCSSVVRRRSISRSQLGLLSAGPGLSQGPDGYPRARSRSGPREKLPAAAARPEWLAGHSTGSDRLCAPHQSQQHHGHLRPRRQSQ